MDEGIGHSLSGLGEREREREKEREMERDEERERGLTCVSNRQQPPVGQMATGCLLLLNSPVQPERVEFES